MHEYNQNQITKNLSLFNFLIIYLANSSLSLVNSSLSLVKIKITTN